MDERLKRARLVGICKAVAQADDKLDAEYRCWAVAAEDDGQEGIKFAKAAKEGQIDYLIRFVQESFCRATE